MTKSKNNSDYAVSPGKRQKMLFIIVVTLLVIGAIGGLWWMVASQYEETDNATLSGHIHPVNARVAGTLMKVMARDNQRVEKGQLLAIIDDTDYQIAFKEAEANLKAAEAAARTAETNITLAAKESSSRVMQAQGILDASRSQINQSQAGISEMQAAVETARKMLVEKQSAYQQAKQDTERYQRVNPEAVSAKKLDDINARLATATAVRDAAHAQQSEAEARLKQSQAALTGSHSRVLESRGGLQNAKAQTMQIDIAKSNYENARATVLMAKAKINEAKQNLAYTRIYAPVSGRIGQKNAESGQQIQPGEPLMAVVPDNVWVVANFKETQLTRMRSGQSAEISIDAFPGHTFHGHVESFSPATGAQFALLPPENATGNFTKIVQRIPVKILIDTRDLEDYQQLLAPGMSVMAKVHVTEKPAKSTQQPVRKTTYE